MDLYRFEKLSEDNLADLIPVYKGAFSNEISLEFIKKKQNTSFSGLFNVGYIAYSEKNKPVAFYGVYPCFIDYEGKKYLVAQSGDTMTHSEHGGKGLFTALANETYNYCKLNGIHFVFGFPNQNSYPGFTRKLGWIHFDDLHSYQIRVKCVPWIRIKNLFHLPQQIHSFWCNLILKLLKKGKPFESSSKNKASPVVDHSVDFFAYKKYDNSYILKIEGINVWLKFDELFLLIGDIEKCNELQFLNVVNKLKTIASFLGLAHIRFSGSPNTWGIDMFQKYGKKMDTTYPIAGVNFTDIIPMEKIKFTMADNDTF